MDNTSNIDEISEIREKIGYFWYLLREEKIQNHIDVVHGLFVSHKLPTVEYTKENPQICQYIIVYMYLNNRFDEMNKYCSLALDTKNAEIISELMYTISIITHKMNTIGINKHLKYFESIENNIDALEELTKLCNNDYSYDELMYCYEKLALNRRFEYVEQLVMTYFKCCDNVNVYDLVSYNICDFLAKILDIEEETGNKIIVFKEITLEYKKITFAENDSCENTITTKKTVCFENYENKLFEIMYNLVKNNRKLEKENIELRLRPPDIGGPDYEDGKERFNCDKQKLHK